MSSLFLWEPVDLPELMQSFERRLLGDGDKGRASGPRTESKVEVTDREWKPPMNLCEDTKGNTVDVTFDLPGLSKDDVEIVVQDNRLTVSGTVADTRETQEGQYAVKERRFGRFSRTLQLPQGVKDKDITARMEHGVLTTSFPKVGPESARKKIAIQ